MALSINFAQRPFRDYRPVNLAIVLSLLLGGVLFALNLRDFFSFRKEAAGTRASIEQLNHEASLAEEITQRERARVASLRLAEIRRQSETLNALFEERRFSWSLLLSHLEKALPGEVYLTSLAPAVHEDGSADLSLNCVGKTPDSIVKTIAALAKDPHFENAVPHSETDPEKGSPEGFRFTVSVRYRPQGAA
jgi:Tfp pilus assembly protein PilN